MRFRDRSKGEYQAGAKAVADFLRQPCTVNMPCKHERTEMHFRQDTGEIYYICKFCNKLIEY